MNTMKICRGCKNNLPVEFFRTYKKPDGTLAPTARCKPCQVLQHKISRGRNLERYNAKRKEWRDKNIEKSRKANQEYALKNRANIAFRFAKQRAIHLNRVPPWMNKGHFEQIRAFYHAAHNLNLMLDVEYEVAPIVRLQTSMSSGLFVPWNLHIIPRKDNIRRPKSRKCWPIERVKELRENGLTVVQIAKELGVSIGSISLAINKLGLPKKSPGNVWLP